jgi:crotonobetainyl-CoA:carnitine CoA-transferase CaiB-like acyl-CoA transferase
VKAFLRETFEAQPLAHWEAFLQPLDVCWAPVRTLREALASPQVQARGMRRQSQQQGFGGGSVTELGIPIRYRHEPGQANTEIPQLGEHTFSVLRTAGLSDTDIAQASGLPLPQETT